MIALKSRSKADVDVIMSSLRRCGEMRSNSQDHDSRGHRVFLENQLKTMEVCSQRDSDSKGRARMIGCIPPVLGSLVKLR